MVPAQFSLPADGAVELLAKATREAAPPHHSTRRQGNDADEMMQQVPMNFCHLEEICAAIGGGKRAGCAVASIQQLGTKTIDEALDCGSFTTRKPSANNLDLVLGSVCFYTMYDTGTNLNMVMPKLAK